MKTIYAVLHRSFSTVVWSLLQFKYPCYDDTSAWRSWKFEKVRHNERELACATNLLPHLQFSLPLA